MEALYFWPLTENPTSATVTDIRQPWWRFSCSESHPAVVLISYWWNKVFEASWNAVIFPGLRLLYTVWPWEYFLKSKSNAKVVQLSAVIYNTIWGKIFTCLWFCKFANLQPFAKWFQWKLLTLTAKSSIDNMLGLSCQIHKECSSERYFEALLTAASLSRQWQVNTTGLCATPIIHYMCGVDVA